MVDREPSGGNHGLALESQLMPRELAQYVVGVSLLYTGGGTLDATEGLQAFCLETLADRIVALLADY